MTTLVESLKCPGVGEEVLQKALAEVVQRVEEERHADHTRGPQEFWEEDFPDFRG